MSRLVHSGLALVAFAALGGASCLPVDTRTPPGSILLTVTSGDEPSVTTADGWSIVVERLVLGIGGAALEYPGCTRYSESHYLRLLDGRLPTDQRLGILFGLGQCQFQFFVGFPSAETLLGEGVSEADRELMGVGDVVEPGRREGIAVDFAATARRGPSATRGPETKRVHWMFRQTTNYMRCMRSVSGVPEQSLELQSDVNLTLHIAVRGVALFADDANPTTALLRFDPIAAADTNSDGDVTLDELGEVSLDVARQSGPYGVGDTKRGVPHTLEDYLHLVLLRRLVGFREDVACDSFVGGGPPVIRP